MRYQITSDNIEMSPSMEALTKEKFKTIEKRLVKVDDSKKFARVVLNTGPGDKQFTVKISLTVGSNEYFTQGQGFSLEHALIDSVHNLERMLDKDKES